MSRIIPDEVFHITSQPSGHADRTIGHWEMNLIPQERKANIRQYKIIHTPVLQCSRLEFDSAVSLISSVPHGFITFAISQNSVGRPCVNHHELRPNEIIVLCSGEPVHYTCEPNEVLFTLTTTLEHYAECLDKKSVIDVLANRKQHSYQAANFKLIQSAIQAIDTCFASVELAIDKQSGRANTSAVENALLISLLQALTPPRRSRLKPPARRTIAIEAINYIHENTRKTLSMKSLVTKLQTTTRSLHLGFVETFGITPIAYIRNLRLANVRRDLIRNTWPTVTEAAMNWHFHHLGRFSKAYQDAYGEIPSLTSRRNATTLATPDR